LIEETDEEKSDSELAGEMKCEKWVITGLARHCQ
jgi:hypothetical protein